jgi:hypothetical protein
MTDTPVQSDLSGNVLFYSKPEPLNSTEHGALGVNPTDKPYAFVAQSNVVPLTVTEFSAAALSYPVVFFGDNKAPVAIMGLRVGENLFVSPEGDFDTTAYLPAFVRRYPFVFANDTAQKRMVLCIDRGAPIVAEGGAAKLFEDGKPTPFTDNAMQFCSTFEEERQRTEAFSKMLMELDLFEVREANYTVRQADGTPGPSQKLADYYAISEDKMRNLTPEQLVTLRDNGALGQIYAHLVSLTGWDRLIAKAFQRAEATGTLGKA